MSGGCRDCHYHPYKRLNKQTQDQRSGKPRKTTHFSKKKDGRQSNKFSSRSPRVSHHINDNCCVSSVVPRLLAQSIETIKFVNLCQLLRTGNPEEQRDCRLVSVSPDQTSVWGHIKSLSDSKQCYKLSCCKSCTYCKRAVTKERRKSSVSPTMSFLKIGDQCFAVLINCVLSNMYQMSKLLHKICL